MGFSCPSLFLLLFLFLWCFEATAQGPNAGSRKLLHGSIFTAQGQPAVEAAVEVWDQHGIKVASSVTDGAGSFEISGAAMPGEYVFLVASAFRIRVEPVRLEQTDLELRLVLPASGASAAALPGRYLVSVERLGVPAKAWAHLATAQREFSKMKFDEAEREINGALQADPAFAQAFAMRAFLRLAERDPNQAAEDARHAVSLNPDDTESFIALAMSYNSLRKFQEAEEAVQHALSLRPDSWQGRLELAKSFYGQGDFVVALRELDLGNIDFPDAHLVRGNVLISLGRKREAGEEFSSFLREAPGDPRGEQVGRVVAALRQVGAAASASDR
jgi:tetratricopeptide (TPR) repeat protein